MDNRWQKIAGIALACFSIAAHAEDAAAPAEKADKPAKNPFAMTTNAFLDAGALPVLYTCDGKDESPQLSWSHAPAKAKSFALIMSDKNAPKGEYYHWVVFNMPTSIDNLPQGVKKAPKGSVFGLNSLKKQQYSGPCPPKGAAHTYKFKLFALDTKLALPKGADATAVKNAMKNHIVGETELSATYSRWINA